MYKSKLCVFKGCDAIFTPTTGNQKYCIDCKHEAKKNRERNSGRMVSRKKNNYTLLTKSCKFCGKLFSTYYRKKITCGAATCKKRRQKLNSRSSEVKRSEKRKTLRLLARVKRREERLEYIENFLHIEGYLLVDSTNYINSHRGYLVVSCPEGHIWETTFHNFKDSGNRCMVCYASNNYTSRLEQSLRDYFNITFPDININYNDRKQIAPKELDLFFPDHNIAVELCGLYWHGEVSSGKPRAYHYNKMKACAEKDIRLITVFEDELVTNFILVISRILQALSLTKRVIYARKCKVDIIPNKTANEFFNNYHLQGKSTSKVSWGLFYNNELIGACSLGNPVRQHTSSPHRIELKRLCFLPNTAVVGGAGKLFKRAKLHAIENDYSVIRSYCDMRYANLFNTVYEVLGFNLITTTKYTPHYFKQGIRYRNFSLRKTEEERLGNKTEFELRVAQGYDRIWDCGHRTYDFKLTNFSNS